MPWQKLKMRQTEIPNCRSWRTVEIPDFAEAEDKISLQIFFIFFAETEHKYQITETEEKKKYQIAEADTKLQKPKRRRNTKTIAQTKHKYQIAEADTKLQKPKRRRNTKTIAET